MATLSSIRRSELESRSSSITPSSPDAVLEAQFYEHLRRQYGEDEEKRIFDDGVPTQEKEPRRPTLSVDADDTYSFRLFAKHPSPGNNRGQDLQRIALRSPTPVEGEPGLKQPRRSDRYYFSGVPSAEEADKYREVAVSGKQILEGSKTRWNGMEVPWRVTVIGMPGQRKQGSGGMQAKASSRKRIGKKRRIIIRKRSQARSAKEVAMHQAKVEKAAAEKEKRTRRNREKKVKKKEKEKSKKSQAAGDNE